MTSIHRAAAGIIRRVAPRRERVLFSFTGGSGAWPGMGSYLYRHEPVFRDSIDDASAVVEEVLGWSPVRGFRGEAETAPTPVLAQRARLIQGGLLQIAQADLWRHEGIEPSGVIAVSMGEVVAPYAAGAFTRHDSARVLAALSHAVLGTPSPQRLFVLAAGPAEAGRLCRAAPAPLDYLGSTEPGSSVVLCLDGDVEAIRAFLGGKVVRDKPTEWSFHHPRLEVAEAWMREVLRDVRAVPARCPVYSAAAGGKLPGDAPFDAAFYIWMGTRCFHLDGAASAAMDDGFDTVVTLGAQADTRRSIAACAAARGRSPRFVDTTREGDERGAWMRARAAMRGVRGQPLPAPPPASARTVDFDDPAVQARLPAVHEELRRAGGVHFIERNGYWLLLSHADVQGALARPALFSSRVPSVELTDAVLLGNDPPAHTAIRRTLARHFAAPELARRAELAERIVGELVQPLLEGRELDVVRDFAGSFASRLGADVLGLDADAVASFQEPTRAAPADAVARLDSAIDAVLHRSTTYAWLRDPEGGALDHDSARSLVRLLWIAGTDTLKRTLPSAVLLLLRNPGVRARIHAEPGLAERFVDEVLRLGPAEQVVVRVATEDVEVGGATIPAGAMVRLSLAAANRDPARFPDPGTVRLDRPPGAHLAFGGGVHRCLGAAQARAQLSVALRVLLRLAPALHAVQPLETIRSTPGAPLSGIEQLVIGG